MPDPYCIYCDHDMHICPGCGDRVSHEQGACVPCLDEVERGER